MDENRIILEVDIETEATKLKIMELQETLKDQKKELKSIEDVGGKTWQEQAKQVVNTDNSVKELNNALRQKVKEDKKNAEQVALVDKAMQGQLKTDREINKGLAALRQQRMDVNKDTAEGARRYEALTNQIQTMSKQQVEANRSGKMYWDNVGNYQESVEKALASTTKGFYAMRQEMLELNKIDTSNLSPEQIREVEAAQGQLNDTMDKTKARIKVQAMDDLPAMVASMQAVTSAVQLGVGAFSLLGASSEQAEKLQQTMIQLVGVSQALSQVQQLVASGEAAALAIKIKTIAVTSAQAVATKVATVAQWAFNAAMTANPIGLIIAAIGALVAGIVWLIANIEDVIGWFTKLGDYIRQFAVWLGLATEKEEELTEAEKEAAAAKKAHAKEVQNLRVQLARMTKENEKRQKQLDDEIRLLESQGAATEDIVALQREKIELNREQAKTELSLFEIQNKQLVQLIQQYDLAGRAVPSSIRKQIEAYEGLKETVESLDTDLEVFDNNERRRLQNIAQDRAKANEKRSEEEKKANEKRIKDEEFAAAKLRIITAKAGEERLNALLNMLYVERRHKLENTELTESQRKLIIEEYNQAEQEAKDAHNKSLQQKEQAYLDWLNGKQDSELSAIDEKHDKELEKLKEFHADKLMSDVEYWDMYDEIELQRELEKEELRKEKEEKEREEYDAWMEGQKTSEEKEIQQMAAKLAKFDELRKAGLISEEEHAAASSRISKQIADAYVQMQATKMQASLAATDSLVQNVGEALGAEAEAAKISQAIGIAQTGIDVVRAISQATALGPPQNIPFILLALAQTAGLISEIKSISVPDASFDGGGYTGDGGKYSPAGVVHKGEVVWSQSDVAMSGGWEAVDSMRPTSTQGRGHYYDGGVVGFGETGELADDMQLQVVEAIREMKPKVSVEDINAVMDEESNRVEVAKI